MFSRQESIFKAEDEKKVKSGSRLFIESIVIRRVSLRALEKTQDTNTDMGNQNKNLIQDKKQNLKG